MSAGASNAGTQNAAALNSGIQNAAAMVDNLFHIISVIGAGGDGTVYKAWHTRLRKHVAVKALECGGNVHGQRAEADALKTVNSPYLPQVYDFVTQSGRTFCVMEYVEGESLYGLLERGQNFTLPDILMWYGQLASALQALHRRGIYHRDIKPANVMLTPEGDVCLIDLNSALVKGGRSSVVSRSIGYASPEQSELFERIDCCSKPPGTCTHRGMEPCSSAGRIAESTGYGGPGSTASVFAPSGHYCGCNETEFITVSVFPSARSGIYCTLTAPAIDWARSDIYSLGATMYHLLTGRRPKELAAEVVALSGLGRYDKSIARIIDKSMHPEPLERYASAEQLAEAIASARRLGCGVAAAR